ncbi:alpha/beta hydrolase [Erythrobacter sp. JK5]|uniref:alpha/beta hydrolase n=1 Tax=Erythrobacter sp. JK5 TaxID=2829500 RepID=UPI001BA700BA|nr:alpha/beta hydrolase [Erythrobacter sp. JK5]QUL37884.1 alpha/beta fold hydrolase [Erythrobacter sp. JK5]
MDIRTIGPLAALHDGAELPLPASRKTRALMAYLALSSGTHARQALCDLLWDTPDDPRAALRWSLSKLRPVLNAGGVERLRSDRQNVWLDRADLELDIDRALSADRPSSEAAESLWQIGNGTLLEDCEMPNQQGFTAWLDRRRAELQQARSRLAAHYAQLEALQGDERDRWAQRWLEGSPFDAGAARCAVETRHALAGKDAAHELAAMLERRFGEAELEPPRFFGPAAPGAAIGHAPIPEQSIRFVDTCDRVSIAWASVGAQDSPPLVKAANWLNHLELDWEAPIWSPLFRELSGSFRLVRYDERGCGLSDWDAAEITFESFVNDLEKVVDAAGLDRFPLLGISQGAAVSIEYAARYPERVSHLILFGAYDCGWRHVATPDEVREREAVMVLTETGWGSDNPAYRHMFSQTFMPDATAEELTWFDEFQRLTTSAQNAVRFLEAFSTIDVRHRLAEVQCPTLVLHSRGDQRIPLATGRSLAGRIPNARFASLESANHLLLGREPASDEFIRLVREFLTK